MSLMREHQEKIRKQQAAGETPAAAAPQADAPLAGLTAWQKEHKQQLETLALARAQLKSIQSHSARAVLKRDEYLPVFVEYLERYRDAGESFDNELITQVVVWAFDAQQIDLALEWADFAQASGQTAMPEGFNSSLESFVASALFDWAEPQFKAGNAIEPWFSQVYEQIGLWDLHDELAAKYHKLAGLQLIDSESLDDKQTALACFEQAQALNPKVGVGTRIDKLTKQLAKAADESGAAPDSDATTEADEH